MEILWSILIALVIGLIAGLIARAVIPGKQHMSIGATIVLGLIGSLVGNVLAGLIQGEGLRFTVGGWWASILGAIIVLAVYVYGVQGRRRRAVTH